MTTKTREETKDYFGTRLLQQIKDYTAYPVKDNIDCAYCEGYNTVIEAAEECLPPEEYQKLIDYLHEKGR